MSLHLGFEPHSWYKGFAISKLDDPSGVEGKWQAFTDDGMTYRVVQREADTLRELKQQITEYREHEAARIKRLYERVE